MSIANAKKFVRTAMTDKTVRDAVNSASNFEEVQSTLAERNLEFTYPEFDEAYHNLLTQCQEEEQADQLKEFKMWWDLTMAMTQK